MDFLDDDEVEMLTPWQAESLARWLDDVTVDELLDGSETDLSTLVCRARLAHFRRCSPRCTVHGGRSGWSRRRFPHRG